MMMVGTSATIGKRKNNTFGLLYRSRPTVVMVMSVTRQPVDRVRIRYHSRCRRKTAESISE